MSHRPNTNLYGYPDMGRTGLGHSLLAWGRCAVWCRDTGATMLAPRWLRARVGPYLRRERDKRNYFLLFHKGDYVSEPVRSALLLTANRVYAELDLPERGTIAAHRTVVVFRNALSHNERKMFHLVANDGPYLHDQLIRMTRSRYVPKPPEQPFIALHVRMGDFSAANSEQLKAGATNSRIPPAWYAAILMQLRKRLGHQMPAVLFSDGPDEALAPILTLPNVRRAPRQQSITDLLSIAQSSALIASGSGFSQWGSFLGSVPAISFPGQGLSASPNRPCIECDASQTLPAEFIARLLGQPQAPRLVARR